jgi:hypothetical protein
LEKKFVRTLVMVDAPVLDKDRNNGGKSVGGNGGGGSSNSRGGSAVCCCDQHPLPPTGPCAAEEALQRNHWGGGGHSARPTLGCGTTIMTAGVATALSRSNNIAPMPSAEGGAAQVEAGPAIAAGSS